MTPPPRMTISPLCFMLLLYDLRWLEDQQPMILSIATKPWILRGLRPRGSRTRRRGGYGCACNDIDSRHSFVLNGEELMKFAPDRFNQHFERTGSDRGDRVLVDAVAVARRGGQIARLPVVGQRCDDDG